MSSSLLQFTLRTAIVVILLAVAVAGAPIVIRLVQEEMAEEGQELDLKRERNKVVNLRCEQLRPGERTTIRASEARRDGIHMAPGCRDIIIPPDGSWSGCVCWEELTGMWVINFPPTMGPLMQQTASSKGELRNIFILQGERMEGSAGYVDVGVHYTYGTPYPKKIPYKEIPTANCMWLRAIPSQTKLRSDPTIVTAWALPRGMRPWGD